MRKEYEETIFGTFPEYFEPEKIRRDPTRSCMSFGFRHGDGWYIITWQMLDLLRRLCPTAQVRVAQVKEKFSGLRIVHDLGPGAWEEEGPETPPGDPEDYRLTHSIVSNAMRLSRHMCESCGAPAEERVHYGWHLTLCDRHYDRWVHEERRV